MAKLEKLRKIHHAAEEISHLKQNQPSTNRLDSSGGKADLSPMEGTTLKRDLVYVHASIDHCSALQSRPSPKTPTQPYQCMADSMDDPVLLDKSSHSYSNPAALNQTNQVVDNHVRRMHRRSSKEDEHEEYDYTDSGETADGTGKSLDESDPYVKPEVMVPEMSDPRYMPHSSLHLGVDPQSRSADAELMHSLMTDSHCRTLCCGRAYRRVVRMLTGPCDCHFNFCCQVACQKQCQVQSVHYECLWWPPEPKIPCIAIAKL